jgi:hypothetical protein
MRPASPTWRHWLWAALAYGFVALVVTYPVVLHMGTRVAGEAGSDALEFVWSTWWWKHALLDLHQNPVEISVLNYPDGQRFPLLPLMSQWFLLALPFTASVSPAFAYNAVFLASFVLAGLAGYALCVELSGNRWAAFVGGLIWAFFPNMLGHAQAGHLFCVAQFTFPLLTLWLLRLLQRPTLRHALWAGLSLALVGTVHPIYLAYLIAPLVLVLVGYGLWQERRAYLTWERVRAMGLALGLGGLLLSVLLIPALLDMLRGRMSFLAARGTTGFALDLLAYILPAPHNPLVLHTPLAGLAERVTLSEDESIAYLGWLPIALAVIGARARWPRTRVWCILALIGGVLALGPLLKIGGGLVRVPVEDGWYPVLMPYALLARLPFFQWSRTPGRIVVLVALALSVLATFGLDRVLQLPVARTKSGLLVAICTVAIVVGYTVRFPFPTIPVDEPEPLLALRSDPADGGVINVPMPDKDANLRSLYWQTIHQRPIVGGRVYRDIPGTEEWYSWLSRLLLSSTENDVIPVASPAQRVAALRAIGVGWVIVDAQADRQGQVLATLTTLLGQPGGVSDELALFTVPPADLQGEDIVWTLGDRWYPAQDWGDVSARWFSDRGRVYLYSEQERSGRLVFGAIPGQRLHRLTVKVNGVPVGRFAVGDWTTYRTEPFVLRPGLNVVDFADKDGAQSYVGDVRCAGGSPVSGPYPRPLPCDAADRTTRELSLGIFDLHFAAETDDRSSAVLARFGDSIELLDYEFPSTAEPGGAVPLHLVWRATADMAEELTVFVHILGPDGTLVAQDDAWPVAGAHPTSRWEVGETVAYNVSLRLPPAAARGTYRVGLGIYRWPSMERLDVSGTMQAQDRVVMLGEISVP